MHNYFGGCYDNGFAGNRKTAFIEKKIYERIEQAIINGELKPGEKIIESQLAQEMGISRTPVREALRLLESKGYVSQSEKGGVNVTEISKENIKEWSEIKNVLNELAIKKAAENITEEQLEELEKVLLKMKSAVEEDNEIEISQGNAEFHSLIYKASQNNLIISIGKEYQNYTFRLRKYLAKLENRRKKAYKEHEKIYEALKEKNKEKAVQEMKRHSQNMQTALIEHSDKINK